MTLNFGSLDKVLWSELLPYEFKKRLADSPLVFLPLGICEPHGQISAFGLDTIKAEWLCIEAARRCGGVVAPALGYHIHESGYHARWLEDTVGRENPHMTAMPPHIMLPFFLYQLRSFVNAGFRAIFVVSGHSGGNQYDLRRVAEAFSAKTGVSVRVVSDPELVEGMYEGDHAGKYEISQLQFLRPDLIDFTRIHLQLEDGSGGRLALGDDALEASAEHGERIMNACLNALCKQADQVRESLVVPMDASETKLLSYEIAEEIWRQLVKQGQWITTQPHPGQNQVSEHSPWKPFEHAEETMG